jgi:major inositol transporter-like SP family MFS transporter
MIVLTRWLIGLAAGGSTVTVPLYVAEICRAEKRGKYGVLIQFATSSGILTAYLTGYGLSFVDPSVMSPWRLMFLAGTLPALLFFSVNNWLLVESPRWIAAKQWLAPQAAADSAGKDRNDDEEKPLLVANSDNKRLIRRSVLIVLGLQLCQQLSGFNTIVYYSGVIFTDIGFQRQNALLAR